MADTKIKITEVQTTDTVKPDAYTLITQEDDNEVETLYRTAAPQQIGAVFQIVISGDTSSVTLRNHISLYEETYINKILFDIDYSGSYDDWKIVKKNAKLPIFIDLKVNTVRTFGRGMVTKLDVINNTAYISGQILQGNYLYSVYLSYNKNASLGSGTLISINKYALTPAT